MLTFAEVAYSFKEPAKENALVWKYLADRGIDKATKEALGLRFIPALELIAAVRNSPRIANADGRMAIVFPHHAPGSAEPGQWWSARMVDIGGPRPVGSGAQSPAFGKMFCPPNEPPHAYCPPIYNWGNLQRGQRVYIHESAIKAVNGCLLGQASIGLNGVWGWGSRKHGLALVEELKALQWRALDLKPVIVFDSNAWTNTQVQAAEAALAEKLFSITGQRAVALRVPLTAGRENEGFDDFRMRVGDEIAREFLLKGEPQEIDMDPVALGKIQLNSEVCVVMSLGLIAEQGTGPLMTSGVFTGTTYADRVTLVETDAGAMRQVSIAKEWLKDERRTKVDGLEYAPGAPRLVPRDPLRGSGLPNLNTWSKMGVEPEEGDVEPWLELLVNGIPTEDLRQWLIAWLAYPLQNLGKRSLSYPLVFGPSGTGKGQLFRPFHRIYGKNAVLIGKESILSSFNSIYAQKQFIHVDELQRAKGDGDDAVTQKIKMLTTSETLTVNTKGIKEYTVNNVAALAITSNYWDCVKLDADDRRACVIQWAPSETGGIDRRGDEPYWIAYTRWADGVGAAYLYDWLLKQDIRWYHPSSWAPDTLWKNTVKEATMDFMELWVRDLWADEAGDMLNTGSLDPVGRKKLFTSKEVCAIFLGKPVEEVREGEVRRMGAALRNVGFKQAGDGANLRRPKGAPERFWVLRGRTQTWTAEKALEHLREIYR